VAVAAGLPFVLSGYSLYLVDVVLLAVVGAVALNLLIGNAGQISLGNAAFLGIGAFTAVFVGGMFHLPFFVSVAAAMIMSGLIGLVVGVPALRLRGMYLLLATLAVHYIFLFLANLYQQMTVGPAGFNLPPADVLAWHPVNNRDWYLVLLVLCAVVLFAAVNLLRTRAGRAWALIRHKEPVAEALGIPVARYKILAFVVSSMLVGLQGAVTAYFIGNVSVEQWDLNTAIAYVAMIVLGGLGSIAGSVIGAAIVTILPTAIANFLATTPGIPAALSSSAGPLTTVFYGLLIVVTLLVAPRGIAGLIQARPAGDA
jgi:branched-chain amino acid transport system permease protein